MQERESPPVSAAETGQEPFVPELLPSARLRGQLPKLGGLFEKYQEELRRLLETPENKGLLDGYRRAKQSIAELAAEVNPEIERSRQAQRRLETQIGGLTDEVSLTRKRIASGSDRPTEAWDRLKTAIRREILGDETEFSSVQRIMERRSEFTHQLASVKEKIREEQERLRRERERAIQIRDGHFQALSERLDPWAAQSRERALLYTLIHPTRIDKLVKAYVSYQQNNPGQEEVQEYLVWAIEEGLIAQEEGRTTGFKNWWQEVMPEKEDRELVRSAWQDDDDEGIRELVDDSVQSFLLRVGQGQVGHREQKVWTAFLRARFKEILEPYGIKVLGSPIGQISPHFVTEEVETAREPEVAVERKEEDLREVVFHFPTLGIEGLSQDEELEEAIGRMGKFDPAVRKDILGSLRVLEDDLSHNIRRPTLKKLSGGKLREALGAGWRFRDGRLLRRQLRVLLDLAAQGKFIGVTIQGIQPKNRAYKLH